MLELETENVGDELTGDTLVDLGKAMDSCIDLAKKQLKEDFEKGVLKSHKFGLKYNLFGDRNTPMYVILRLSLSDAGDPESSFPIPEA